MCILCRSRSTYVGLYICPLSLPSLSISYGSNDISIICTYSLNRSSNICRVGHHILLFWGEVCIFEKDVFPICRILVLMGLSHVLPVCIPIIHGLFYVEFKYSI